MIQRKQFDISVIKARDFTMLVYIRDKDNNPIDVTNWSGAAQVHETNDPDSKLILAFTVSVADGAAGKMQVSAAKADTNVCDEQGYWDLVLTNDKAITDTYLVGNVTFETVPTTLT